MSTAMINDMIANGFALFFDSENIYTTPIHKYTYDYNYLQSKCLYRCIQICMYMYNTNKSSLIICYESCNCK